MSATPIPAYLRQQVVDRYGTRCLACGVQTTPAWWDRTALHLDHIVSESYGGRTELNNLQPLCRTCNLVKGYRTIDYRGGGVVLPHVLTAVVIRTGDSWKVVAQCEACTRNPYRFTINAADQNHAYYLAHSIAGRDHGTRCNTVILDHLEELIAGITQPLTAEDCAQLFHIMERLNELIAGYEPTLDAEEQRAEELVAS